MIKAWTILILAALALSGCAGHPPRSPVMEKSPKPRSALAAKAQMTGAVELDQNSDGKMDDEFIPSAITRDTELSVGLAGKQNSLGFTPENAAHKGQANGYASLGADGIVPAGQLPAQAIDTDDQTAAEVPATPWSGYVGTNVQALVLEVDTALRALIGGGGSMTWPGSAGVAVYGGAGAWSTSLAVGTGANNLVQLNASAQLPAVSAALLTNFPTLNQNTTGTAATVTGATQSAITSAANLAGVGTITSGTWSGSSIDVAHGGSGRNTGSTAYSLLATGTTATGAQQTLANGATTTILVGGGASALPVWTTATGSGAPVRATSPTLVTPALGTPSGGNLANCTFPTLNQNTTGTAAGLTAQYINWGSASGGSSIANKPTLGTASALNVGTAANNVVQLTASGALPAVSGANLTNLPAASLPSWLPGTGPTADNQIIQATGAGASAWTDIIDGLINDAGTGTDDLLSAAEITSRMTSKMAAPGPIGTTTPNTGTFTSLTATSFDFGAPDTGETGEIGLQEDPANGANVITLKAPAALAADLVITLPAGAVPASATAPCTAGQWWYNASYWYVCVAANTWARAALATW